MALSDPAPSSRPAPWGALALTGALLAVGLLTAGMSPETHRLWVERVGLDLDTLKSLRLWAFPVATLFQADPGLGPRFFILLAETAVTVGLLEAACGARRAVLTFFVSSWIAAVFRLATLAMLAAFGSAHARALLHVADTGSSAAATGALAAAAVTARGVPRALLSLVLLGWLLYGATFRLDVAIVHVWGALAGASLATLISAIPAPAYRARRPHIKMRG